MTQVVKKKPHNLDLDSFEEGLQGEVKLLAKHHAARNEPKTPDEFRVLAHRKIELAVQQEVYKNQQTLLPISGLALVYKIRQDAEKKIAPLRATIEDNELALQKLRPEQKQYAPHKAKRNMQNIALCATLCAGLLDGYLLYPALRYLGLGSTASGIAAVALAVVISLAIHFGARFIKKGDTPKDKITRTGIMLVLAFAAFYGLAAIRASGMASDRAIDAALTHSQSIQPHTTSPLVLCMISFAIFCVALSVACAYAKSGHEEPEERKASHIANNIARLEREITIAKEEIEEIRERALKDEQEAHERFEEAVSREEQLQCIAEKALNTYIEYNKRHRTDGMLPAFFIHPPAFQFKLFLDEVKHK